MRVRDAVEADVERLAALAELSTAAALELVHERTVRVALDDERDGDDPGSSEPESADSSGWSHDTGRGDDASGANDATGGEDASGANDTTGGEDASGTDAAGRADDAGNGPVVGFVAFDARPEVVDVTRLCGEGTVLQRLLREPAGFARREGMAVETVVLASRAETRAALERFGFREVGAGPLFSGDETRRYRWTPAGEDG